MTVAHILGAASFLGKRGETEQTQNGGKNAEFSHNQSR
jgi:hypothetical protein